MAQARPAVTGFTLIEVVIALAIVAITTTFAMSSYRRYMIRSHRVEAAQALLAVAAEQEKFHLAHGEYGSRLDAAAGDEPPGLPVAATTPRGHYTLAVETATAAEYRVAAIATRATGDPLCSRLFIDESGRRGAVDIGGRNSTAECW